MKWFIYAFKNAFNFRGRARRAEFGWFNLINFLIQIGFQMLIAFFFLGSGDSGNDSLAVVGMVFYGAHILYSLISVIPTLSLTVRRMHDLGWSGWWLLWTTLLFISLFELDGSQSDAILGLFSLILIILYAVAILMLYFKDGQIFGNKYGPSPKA